VFGDSRTWACGQATGNVLEVAVGTGLNLDAYPDDVTLTGIDLSDAMLDIARGRSKELGRPATLLQADAYELPFDTSLSTPLSAPLGCARSQTTQGPSPK
jgi:ubiquinone/menaquinone biosynthesis C-methylase UbiE